LKLENDTADEEIATKNLQGVDFSALNQLAIAAKARSTQGKA
jgi:hypothetical protein